MILIGATNRLHFIIKKLPNHACYRFSTKKLNLNCSTCSTTCIHWIASQISNYQFLTPITQTLANPECFCFPSALQLQGFYSISNLLIYDYFENEAWQWDLLMWHIYFHIWTITFSDHYYYHFYYYRGHLPIYFMFQCCYYFIYKRKRKKYQKQKTRQFVTLMLQATVHHHHVLRELKIQKWNKVIIIINQ